MTELETVMRAKMYMDQLSQGIDPISGCPIPDDSTLNNVRLCRCFHYVAGILNQVIQNGGHVGAIEKIPFAISPEQLRRVQISPYPIRITELGDALVQAVGSYDMKRPSATKFSNWLIQKGFLQKESTPDGKNRRVPTATGTALGISAKMRDSQDGPYLALYYDANAQRFLLDNLFEILQG